MSIVGLISEHMKSFTGTVETSEQTVHTESGDVILPRVTSVTITNDGNRLVINFSNPPVAQKRFLGIPVSAKVNPIYVGEDGVTARMGPTTIRLYAEEQP